MNKPVDDDIGDL